MKTRLQINEDLVKHSHDQIHRVIGRSAQLLETQAEIDLFLSTLFGKLLVDLSQQLVPDEELTHEQRVMMMAIYIVTAMAGNDRMAVYKAMQLKNLAPNVEKLAKRMNDAAKEMF